MEGTDITLVMERMVAGLSIRTRYLAERYPYNGEAYRFIVHCIGTEMDFMGEASGDGAGYEPASVTDAKGDVYVPLFHIFPTGEGKTLEIDVYRKDEKLFTITKDNELRPLYAPVGQQTNIDIDFRYADVKVFVSVVPWGTVGQDVEM